MVRLLMLLVLLASSGWCQTTTAPRPRPNILLLVTDDLRWDYFGAAGHPYLQTPAIDNLARHGMRFTQAFVQTPLCSPSRATLLTGLPTQQHLVGSNGGGFPQQRTSIGTRLQQAGYQTAFFGKTGFTDRPEGFDHTADFLSPQAGGRGDTYDSAVFSVNGARVETKGFSTDALTGLVEDYLAGVQGKPFFAYVSLKNPHVPFTPPTRHSKLFLKEQIPLPESFADNVTDLPQMFRQKRGDTKPVFLSRPMRHQYEALERNPSKQAAGPRLIRKYAKMIPSIDESLARIVTALQTNGQWDNTVVIFTSDNGMMLGEKAIFGKELLYEDSIKVPLLVRMPGQNEPRTSDALVLNLDLPPTLLALAGVATPDEMPGRSLLPVLRGERPSDWRTSFVMIAGYAPKTPRPMMIGLRGARYKYVRYLRGGVEEEIFDLQNDPLERTDLSGDSELLRQQRAAFEAAAKQDGVPGQWLRQMPF